MSRVWLRVLLALFVSVHCLPLTEAAFIRDELPLKRRAGVIDDGGDDVSSDTLSRRKRYNLSPNMGWKKKHLTYTFINKSLKMPSDVVEKEFAAALAVWAPHAGLTFTKVEQGPADINVGFYSRDHGDGYPFDGMKNKLAHAFFPFHDLPINIHFDEDEEWISRDTDEKNGTSFFHVALHEIGHLLGLYHSDVRNAVMFVTYTYGLNLTDDDIKGIRVLYPNYYAYRNKQNRASYTTQQPHLDHTRTRKPRVPHRAPTTRHPLQDYPSPPVTRPATDEPPVFCFCNYDTIQILWGKVYGFKDQWVWVHVYQGSLEDGYPKRLHEEFSGLEHVRTVDAAYETNAGKFAIFSGRSIYVFDRSLKRITRDLQIRYKLPPTTQELQAVFLSKADQKTYLFEKTQYWVFDERTNQMDIGYPKPMAEPISSALVAKDHTYFFSGCGFWDAMKDRSSSVFIPDKPNTLRKQHDVTMHWQYPCIYNETLYA